MLFRREPPRRGFAGQVFEMCLQLGIGLQLQQSLHVSPSQSAPHGIEQPIQDQRLLYLRRGGNDHVMTFFRIVASPNAGRLEGSPNFLGAALPHPTLLKSSKQGHPVRSSRRVAGAGPTGSPGNWRYKLRSISNKSKKSWRPIGQLFRGFAQSSSNPGHPAGRFAVNNPGSGAQRSLQTSLDLRRDGFLKGGRDPLRLPDLLGVCPETRPDLESFGEME